MKPDQQQQVIAAKAKTRFQQEAIDLDMENADVHKLVEELRIHQIELEIQNEELRQAQQRVTDVAEQYSALYDFAPVGYLTLDRNGVIQRLNLTAANMLGTAREKLINKPLIVRVPAAYHGGLNAYLRSVMAGNETPPWEMEITRSEGSRRWVSLASSLDNSSSNKPLCRATLTDITALKETEQALRDSEEKYRLIADNTIDCIWRMNMDLQFEYVNPAIFPMLGYKPKEWLGSRLQDHCSPPEIQKIMALISDEIAKGKGASGVTLETSMYHRDGRRIAVEITGKVLWDEHDKPVGLQGVTRDISERKRSEWEVRKFKMLAENVSYGVLIANLNGTITYANAGLAKMHGYRPEELIGSKLSLLYPKEKWNPIQNLGSGAQDYDEFDVKEMSYLRKDGTEFSVLLNCTLVRDDAGEASFLAVTATDITELKSLQAQLQQAQKMEAVGQLAGGIAHDFNNLLTVIINRADFVQEALPPFSRHRDDVREIIDASIRGAALIRQLLAFSRRQYLNIKRLDIGDVIRSVEKMLNRLIGEDIQLNLRLAQEPCLTMADAGQLEQVIVNLAVNARDAMPNGGVLTIETRHITITPQDAHVFSAEPDSPTAGDYVALFVTDTGLGMDKTVQAKIFDPFFTTKDVGQGTGLGLSTVYGIVKQHKGFIRVYSEPVKGTTFRILLPVDDGKAGADRWKDRPAVLRRGNETILLVEDEPGVRRVSAKMLRDLGYHILEAENGKKALEFIQRCGDDIALLLTDVVMPELDGKQLAEQAAKLKPGMKIIYTSGYPEAHLKLRNAWVTDNLLLQKPFILTELADSVRKVLDS